MNEAVMNRAAAFRALHALGELLVLPNAWDAGSARIIEGCGARAIATTSAGLAWARGYPDGDALPPTILFAAIAEMARVIDVPLTVDIEGGYSTEPRSVAETVTAAIDAGAVGINIEDGAGPVSALCAKITAVKTAAVRTGVDLFVNVRTDVYLRGLASGEQAVAETLARAASYRRAGADGLFVPALRDPDAIRTVASAVEMPLNVMILPDLAAPDDLRAWGVRRLSAGSALAQRAHGLTQRAATRLLVDGQYDQLFEGAAEYGTLNAMFTNRGDGATD
jgi:2-methylisocitrate lyase-like PEP mutase family enzyme